MIGIELTPELSAAAVCLKARDFGVILRPLGNVVVWMPPLSIRLEEVQLLETATTQALACFT